MSSNDQWPPVASASKGAAKVNGNKRNGKNSDGGVKESQQQILSVVNEMFGSALEPDVILQVVQNCNWDLQPSIEGLITLTETIENPLIWDDVSTTENTGVPSAIPSTNLNKNSPKNVPASQSREALLNALSAAPDLAMAQKSEKPKRTVPRNRMGSFCGNIAKLKSSEESNARNIENSLPKITSAAPDDDFFFDDVQNYGASGINVIHDTTPKLPKFGDFPNVQELPKKSIGIHNPAGYVPPTKPPTWVQQDYKSFWGIPADPNTKEKFSDTKAAAENKEFNKPEQTFASLNSKTNMRKNESESLCGLKVQYRLSGMESSSDDDADVVIEDESSDYKLNLALSSSISVCQFLSSSTQTAPQRSQPEIHMINTPSPPQTPQRTVHEATLSRIKAAIKKGYKIMILMRGLPGSGKSTLARSIVETTVGGNSSAYIFNTDDFFVTLGHGIYQFDPTKLQDAHSTNQKRVWNAAKEGRSPIIVDNTNTEAWEMRPYAAMAVENGYIVEILEPNTPWAQNVNELAKKNTHDVPKSKIRERYEKYERGLTGKTLLDRFSLKYSPKNVPPQMRKVPPIPAQIEENPVEVEKAAPTIADFKSNWGCNEKNNVVLTSQDIESMQSIDEAHGSIGLISECASVADDSSSSSNNPEKGSTYGDKVYDDYLQDLQDSDESFEILESTTSVNTSDLGKTSGKEEDSRVDSSANTPEVPAELVADAIDSSSSASQQIFGAIGSERKGSLSSASNVGNLDAEKTEVIEHEKTDNVLSQCWDFTLLLGRYKIHSRHDAGENSGVSKDEIKDRKILRSKRRLPQVSADVGTRVPNAVEVEGEVEIEATDKVKGDVENEVKEGIKDKVENETISEAKYETEDKAKDETKYKAEDDLICPPEVPVELANDSEELIEPQDVIIEDIVKTDDVILTDETSPQNFSDNASFVIDPQSNKDAYTTPAFTTEPIEENIEVDSSLLRDALNTEDRVDTCFEKISDDSTKVADEPKVSSAFGSFLNLIKTSILGPTDGASFADDKHDTSDEIDDDAIYDSFLQSIDYKDKNVEVLEENVKNEDTVDFPIEQSDDETQSRPEANRVEANSEQIFPNLSTNPFRQEMLESQLSNESVEVPHQVTDNINSISWKESPFPIDTKISFPVTPKHEVDKSVSKVDASTNTTYYDFNVSYVGGTSEPGYRVLSATNRCINEGNNIIPHVEPPPLKLMLDKSSMTSEVNILAAEPNLHPEKSKDDKGSGDSGDRIQELIELFPHIPIESLTAFYVQQCKRNFEWAVEVLLEDAPNDALKGLVIKRSTVENDDVTGASINLDKKCKKEHEILKHRSHSSSPMHRRKRSKNFRSFSMEFADDRNYPSGESSITGEDIIETKDVDEDDAIFQQLYDNAASAAALPVGTTEIPETSSEEDNEDEIELNFGRDFINQLEKTFGNPDLAFPEEFTPSIRIKKSMAEELHALWIESMYRQLNARHAQLDEMIAKDEAIARALDREESVEPVKEPVVPNFSEIMDMEMALASYKNELKEKIERETPNDMASRLSRQMLYESLPDIDPQTLSEILKAHDGNFKETCETIETSTGRKISKTESLKKQQSLLDRINEESKNRGIEQDSRNTASPVIVVRPDVYAGGAKSDKVSYKSALEKGREARREAEKQFSLRIDYYNKAAEAYRKGYPDVAAYYSQLAKLHSENIQAAHAEAAEAFLSAQICGNDGDNNTLDLHNLFVPEALRALDMFLELQSRKLGKSNKRSATLFIITGRGARSNNGQSRIKPAVSKKLNSKNIRFTEENPGCLKVTLSRKNGILD